MQRRTLVVVAAVLIMVAATLVSAQESTYTLEYGDYLDEIAARYNVSVACLAEASSIENPNLVRPGDTLIIDRNCPPYDGLIEVEGAVTAEATADIEADEAPGQGGGAADTGNSVLGEGDSYTVQRGDVLDIIAAAYDVSVSCLAEANDLGAGRWIYPGDVITIDLDCPRYDGEAFVLRPREEANALGQGGGGSTYIVQVGDTLDSIAAQANIDRVCLAEGNDLTNPGRIFPGDEITIVTNCPPYQGPDSARP